MVCKMNACITYSYHSLRVVIGFWRRIGRLLRRWIPLCKDGWRREIEEDWCVELESKLPKSDITMKRRRIDARV
jgi:hypothetical protein